MSTNKTILYPGAKDKNHQELHEMAFEQISETASFIGSDRETLLRLFWENWNNPMNVRDFLKQANDSIKEFEWLWFDKWDTVFLEKGQYPYVWNLYRKRRKISRKEIKTALFYHSVFQRFAALRQYSHYCFHLEDCAWSKIKYKARLSILDDDIVEKEIIEGMNIIQNNLILALPPYIPGGRSSIMLDRIRS